MALVLFVAAGLGIYNPRMGFIALFCALCVGLIIGVFENA